MNGTCEVWTGEIRDGEWIACGKPAVESLPCDGTGQSLPVCEEHRAWPQRSTS